MQRVAHGEAFEAQVVHAVAVAWGGLQATKRPGAIWVVGARASNVLPWPYGANPRRAHPWAQSIRIPGRVAAVSLNRLVLGMPVRCFPKLAVKGDLFGVWGVEVLVTTLNLVAFVRANRAAVAPAREAAGPRLLKGEKVVPLFGRDSNVVPVMRHRRRCRLWWRRSPGPLAHRGQVVAPTTNGDLIPNQRLPLSASHSPIAQGTPPWHSLPTRAEVRRPVIEICAHQRCNRLAAFLQSCDLEFIGTTRVKAVELLILGGGVRRRRRGRGRGRQRRRRRGRRWAGRGRGRRRRRGRRWAGQGRGRRR